MMVVHVGGLQGHYSTMALAQELLARMGLDILDPHGEETPERFVRMLSELTTPTDYASKWKDFESSSDEMVIVSPIPFYSLCAHHVVPFFGVTHIAYVPNGRIAGLSKFARVVEGISKGFHVQEELTEHIAQYLEDRLEPLGVVVVMDAEHLCMAMRGAKALGVKTRTTVTRGVFADHDRTAKAEFLSAIGQVNK
jgi:GTP cyclohydrolase IA